MIPGGYLRWLPVMATAVVLVLLPPYRAPGQRFQYSNAGYVLLGLIVEELSNTPYAEAVAERVLANMNDLCGDVRDLLVSTVVSITDTH
jgi:CubicO group peptidase (beta-lactamase class C family)